MLHHAATRADWDRRTVTEYHPAGLATEGFVHCSTADQLPATLARHYRGRDDVILLSIDLAALTSDLVWEDTSGRGEAYPHIYGPIPIGAIVAARPLAVDDAGMIRQR